MKTLVPLLCLTVFASPAWSQLVASEEDRVRVYRMTVTPAEQPTPRLRYRLATADVDFRPGNAATYWYRAMIDWESNAQWVRELIGKELQSELDEDDPDRSKAPRYLGADALKAWRSPEQTALEDLPIERAKRAIAGMLGKMRRGDLVEAAGRSSCDWDLQLRGVRGKQIVDFHLPEFQNLRELCLALCLEARVAIAEGRFDDALDTLRINQALANDAAQTPLIVCRFIGAVCTTFGADSVRELQCQPEAPSLYWALVDLPHPLVDLREAIRFEAGIGFRMFELINHPESADRSDSEWDRLLSECLDSLLEQAGDADSPGATRLSEWIESLRDAGRDHPGVRLATSRLLTQGYSAEELDAMPVARVLAIDAAHAYRVVSDTFEVATLLPWAEGAHVRDAAARAIAEADPLGEAPHREVLPIAGQWITDAKAIATGLMVRERGMTALRLVAALRLHVGETGALPESLDDVTVVPVPHDPMTGGPFDYRREGATAVITLAAPASYGRGERYEITLAE